MLGHGMAMTAVGHYHAKQNLFAHLYVYMWYVSSTF